MHGDLTIDEQISVLERDGWRLHIPPRRIRYPYQVRLLQGGFFADSTAGRNARTFFFIEPNGVDACAGYSLKSCVLTAFNRYKTKAKNEQHTI